jgi:hypothetical protein
MRNPKNSHATLGSELKIYGDVHPKCAFAVYNLAAIAAGQGKRDAALRLLRDAFDRKLASDIAAAIEKDHDFKSLRSDVQFKAVVEQLKQRDAVAPKTN